MEQDRRPLATPPGERARERALTEALEPLYERLHARALRPADVADVESLVWPDLEAFVERLFWDRTEFAAHFDVFMRPFEMFRAFQDAETVLDVRAHWGYSALAMRHQGCRARIVSIEAMPFNIPPLARLKHISGGNYDYINLAASDRAQALTFYTPVLNKCAAGGLSSTGGTLSAQFAGLLASRAKHFPAPLPGRADDVQVAIHEVLSAPIDSIVSGWNASGSSVVGVKMDVEGHEAAALAGASDLFQTSRPLLMLEGGNRFQPVVDVLANFGYTYTSRVEGHLVPYDGSARAGDGFWLHPGQMSRYRGLGIVP